MDIQFDRSKALLLLILFCIFAVPATAGPITFSGGTGFAGSDGLSAEGAGLMSNAIIVPVTAELGTGTDAIGSSGVSDPVFRFRYHHGLNAGFGMLNTVLMSPGVYLATSGILTMTSTTNANASVGHYYLVSGGPGQEKSPNGAFWYDDLVFHHSHTGVFLDVNGLLFQNTKGVEVNLFGHGGTNDNLNLTGPGQENWFIAIAAVATPEPASMTLLGLGVAGMAGYCWRFRRQAAIA